jgi:hypothetical protein
VTHVARPARDISLRANCLIEMPVMIQTHRASTIARSKLLLNFPCMCTRHPLPFEADAGGR